MGIPLAIVPALLLLIVLVRKADRARHSAPRHVLPSSTVEHDKSMTAVSAQDNRKKKDLSVIESTCTDQKLPVSFSALRQAAQIAPPPAEALQDGEYESHEFWSEHGDLFRAAWSEVDQHIVPSLSLPSLVDPETNGFVDGIIHPALDNVVRNAWKHPSPQVEADILSFWEEVGDAGSGVYQCQLFTEEGVAKLAQWVDFASSWSSSSSAEAKEVEGINGAGGSGGAGGGLLLSLSSRIPKRRPNGMNRFGFIIDDMEAEPYKQDFQDIPSLSHKNDTDDTPTSLLKMIPFEQEHDNNLPSSPPSLPAHHPTLIDGAVRLTQLSHFRHHLLSTYIQPLARLLFASYVGHGDDVDSYAFTIQYSAEEDVQLKEHTDASVYTLNVNLNPPTSNNGPGESHDDHDNDEDYQGSDVYFVHPETKQRASVRFKPGMAVLHRGLIRHGSYPIENGRRCNLVIWFFGKDGYVRVAPYPEGEEEGRFTREERWAL